MYMRFVATIVAVVAMLFLSGGVAHGQEDYRGPLKVRLKYLGGFDAKLSGDPLGWVDQMVIDEENEEVYLLDRAKKRIVVTTKDGVYLYHFRYTLAGVEQVCCFSLDTRSGDIYIAEPGRIVVLDYRGEYKKEVPLDNIPEREVLEIQSIYVADDGNIYMGDSRGGRIVALEPAGKVVRILDRKTTRASNFKGLTVKGEEVVFLDSGRAKVHRLTMDGRVHKIFGRLSSLLGGFSLPTTLRVDWDRRRIIVVDTNRMMVIAFDMNGNPLYEFGGPRVFRWPRSIEVSREGNIYVADMSGVIRMFEVVEVKEEPPPPPKPARPVPPPEPEAEKKKEPTIEDVEEMVKEEERLLPVYFAFDSAELTPDMKSILDRDAEYLRKDTAARIRIRGYTDERGSEEYNYRLSEKRARAVYDYLVEKGIEPERLEIVPMGVVRTEEKTEEAMAKARRVDFLVVK